MNDSMGEYVASRIVKDMIKREIHINGAEVLMLGITFKENCPDVRNTKIVDVIRALEDYSIKVTTYDPWADPDEVKREYGVANCCDIDKSHRFDAVILGVAHDDFKSLDLDSLKRKMHLCMMSKDSLAVRRTADFKKFIRK